MACPINVLSCQGLVPAAVLGPRPCNERQEGVQADEQRRVVTEEKEKKAREETEVGNLPTATDHKHLVEFAHQLKKNIYDFECLAEANMEDLPAELQRQLKSVSSMLASLACDEAPPKISEQGLSPKSDTAGTVTFQVDASIFKRSCGTFRDAHVDFEEQQLTLRFIDSTGKFKRLQSDRLPGPIVVEEGRYMLDKTGKHLSITVKKANADDKWYQAPLRLCPYPHTGSKKKTTSSCSNSSDRTLASTRASASGGVETNQNTIKHANRARIFL